MKILLTIAFNGAAFCGWQYQPEKRTVQGVLTEASAQIFHCPCRITGCSRTDSGVHALGFAATVEPSDTNAVVPCDKLPLAYSAILPPDVSVLAARAVKDGFHARYAVIEKEYEYRIVNSRIPDPFTVGFCYRYPAPIGADGIRAMQRAADALVGRHDFTAFMAAGSKITDAVRTVSFCRVTAEGENIRINIAADGFLYNMVRIIVGTLLDVGRGLRSSEDMDAILASRARAHAGATAPAWGLYLKEVKYDYDYERSGKEEPSEIE